MQGRPHLSQRKGRMMLLPVTKEPASIARYLAGVGETTEVPRPSPSLARHSGRTRGFAGRRLASRARPVVPVTLSARSTYAASSSSRTRWLARDNARWSSNSHSLTSALGPSEHLATCGGVQWPLSKEVAMLRSVFAGIAPLLAVVALSGCTAQGDRDTPNAGRIQVRADPTAGMPGSLNGGALVFPLASLPRFSNCFSDFNCTTTCFGPSTARQRPTGSGSAVLSSRQVHTNSSTVRVKDKAEAEAIARRACPEEFRDQIDVGCEPAAGAANASSAGAGGYRIASVAVGPAGTVWLATTGGVLAYNGITWQGFCDRPELLPVRSVAVDAHGDAWLGTDYGVTRFDGKAWTTYRESAPNGGPPCCTVWGIAVAPNGAVWSVSTGGAASFDGTRWKAYDTKRGLGLRDGRGVAAGDGGTVWYATPRGAVRFDGERWTMHGVADGLPCDRVTSVAVGPRGEVWFGTPLGLSRLEGKTWSTYTTKDGLAHNSVKAVCVDRDGAVWAGTEGGLSRFDGRWTNYTVNDTLKGLESDVIVSLAAAPDGAIWIVADEGGVARVMHTRDAGPK